MNMIELYRNIIKRTVTSPEELRREDRIGILRQDKNIDALVLTGIGIVPLNEKMVAVALSRSGYCRQPSLRLTENGVVTLNEEIKTSTILPYKLSEGDWICSEEQEREYQEYRKRELGPLGSVGCAYWTYVDGCKIYKITRKEIGAMHNHLLRH